MPEALGSPSKISPSRVTHLVDGTHPKQTFATRNWSQRIFESQIWAQGLVCAWVRAEDNERKNYCLDTAWISQQNVILSFPGATHRTAQKQLSIFRGNPPSQNTARYSIEIVTVSRWMLPWTKFLIKRLVIPDIREIFLEFIKRNFPVRKWDTALHSHASATCTCLGVLLTSSRQKRLSIKFCYWHLKVYCPQGLVVAIGAANFALSEVQADFLHRKGYNLMFILCVVIKAIGYLLCAVSVVSSFFYKLCIWAWKKVFQTLAAWTGCL